MLFLLGLLLQGLLLGMIAVASNPSPYFAALGLVGVSGVGCGLMAVNGGSFLSLVLFLIYLGGMLVVFAYTSALASEPYPESWGSSRVAASFALYVGGVAVGGGLFWGGWFGGVDGGLEGVQGLSVAWGDLLGAAVMYSWGGWMLAFGASALLLTLVVVLEVARGFERGAIRAI
uniref:NADH dehydrogenase subunit 6 n=1 Tax=Pleurosicya micheli TaxID=595630 RepID=UPI0028FCA621|nr:NADH dehydrogenase subunit 6 [Pleurosicya micheli]WNH38105.1 NADH dehydrogenase subunit 6 [Pleurosicya micheli]